MAALRKNPLNGGVNAGSLGSFGCAKRLILNKKCVLFTINMSTIGAIVAPVTSLVFDAVTNDRYFHNESILPRLFKQRSQFCVQPIEQCFVTASDPTE